MKPSIKLHQFKFMSKFRWPSGVDAKQSVQISGEGRLIEVHGLGRGGVGKKEHERIESGKETGVEESQGSGDMASIIVRPGNLLVKEAMVETRRTWHLLGSQIQQNGWNGSRRNKRKRRNRKR